MNNQLEIFKNEEFGEVRVSIIDNEPWFVGKDIAEVLGYSLEPNTNPSMFEELRIYGHCNNEFGNILDEKHLEEAMMEFKPEIVFHLAAQPLVRLSYSEPKLTYETNVIGSLNVLEAARKCKSVKAFVNVTTDKCYENREINRGYTEDEPMGGYDM